MRSIKTLFIILLATAVIPSVAGAQLKNETVGKQHFSNNLTQTNPRSFLSTLGLDPSKFQMQHSYSLSFMNFGGTSLSQGMYLNTMSYQLSAPLSVSLQLGMTHNPLQGTGVNSPFTNGFFVSGANLEYKPSKNFQMSVGYNAYPSSYHNGYYSRGYNRWRQSSFFEKN